MFNIIFKDDIAAMGFVGKFPRRLMWKQDREKTRRDKPLNQDWIAILNKKPDAAEIARRAPVEVLYKNTAAELDISLDE